MLQGFHAIKHQQRAPLHDELSGRRYEDVRRRVPDVSRCERILGVKAAVGLEEGLTRTIEWQRSVTPPMGEGPR